MHDPQRNKRGYTVHPPIDGVQTLDTDRFSISWRPAGAEALGESGLDDFRFAVTALTRHIRAEHSGEPEDIATAQQYGPAVVALATVFNVPGSSLAIPDRNIRYTNVDGGFMAEPIDATLPAEAAFGRVDRIPNPLNFSV